MIKQKTTVILGAGASVHYGFPTGEGLIDAIIKSTSWHNLYVLGGDYYLNEIWQAKQFSKRLRNYDPISIDRFLTLYSSDKEFVAIGKKLIAHEIIKRQRWGSNTRSNPENWYKYLYDFIFSNDDFSEIESGLVKIITFNYDLSLEHFFHSRLEKAPNLTKEQAWETFLKFNENIFHVYGSVYDYTKIHEEHFLCGQNSEERYTHLTKYAEKANHSTFSEAACLHNNIKIIGEERYTKQTDELKAFRSHLQTSHNIYILGFGFDDINMQLVGLDNNGLSNFSKNIYCTNYQNNNIINNQISKIVSKNHKSIVSEKTVHSALREDFHFK